MKTHARILFWLLLLLVGLQWIGDPIEVRLTSDQSPAAGWHHLDDNGPDNAHHYGVALLPDDLTPLDQVALMPPPMAVAGPARLGWLLPASDSRTLPSLAIAPRTPRAPPTA